jgi:hypothetical protein
VLSSDESVSHSAYKIHKPIDRGHYIDPYNNDSNSEILEWSFDISAYCLRCGEITDTTRDSDTNNPHYQSLDDAYSRSNNHGNVLSKKFWCYRCYQFGVQCSICEQSVKDCGYFCIKCGHGGHTDHVKVI